MFGCSPIRIAAYRVLHRLLAPRHPPIALNYLAFARKSHPLFNCQRSVRAGSVQSPTGGGERVRTDGLLRARQALSQLSYTPDRSGGPRWT